MTPLTHISGYAHVAERYGLDEAIFLDALMFWYRSNRGNDRNFHDGRWWTYNSVKAFEDLFPWWNGGQIRRIIERCRDKGALLAGNYNKDRRDRTIWYTPSDELLALYGEPSGENCNCQNQQMQSPEASATLDENGEALPRSTHGETYMENNPPIVPPEGDEPAPADEPKPEPKPKRTRRDRSAPAHDPEAFDTFWAAYPRKDDRKKAVQAWDKLKPARGLYRTMYAALKRQRKSHQWTKDDGQYIPLFSTWLNGRKWENQGVDLSLLSPEPRASGGWSDYGGGGRT